jgi:hypothetical protein
MSLALGIRRHVGGGRLGRLRVHLEDALDVETRLARANLPECLLLYCYAYCLDSTLAGLAVGFLPLSPPRTTQVLEAKFLIGKSQRGSGKR